MKRVSVLFILVAATCGRGAFAADIDGDGVKDSADYCCNTPPGAEVNEWGVSAVDWVDFIVHCSVDLQQAGAIIHQLPGPYGYLYDLDDDEDLDLADIAVLQNAFAPYTGGACCAERALAWDSFTTGSTHEFSSAYACFSGTAGEWVSLYLKIRGLESMTLSRPDGWSSDAELQCNDDACQLECAPLPADGEYFIRISSNFDYTLHLISCGPDADPTIIPLNTPIEGRIDWIGESDVFQFWTEPQVTHRIEWTTKTPAGELSLQADLQTCNASCEIDIPAYPEPLLRQITVDPPGVGVGDYQIQVKTVE